MQMTAQAHLQRDDNILASLGGSSSAASLSNWTEGGGEREDVIVAQEIDDAHLQSQHQLILLFKVGNSTGCPNGHTIPKTGQLL